MIQMQDVMSKPMPEFREGSIIKGQILEVRPREVLVDVGYKSEGVIPLSEFEDAESLQVGDEVEVLLERLENEEGMVVLSKEKAAYRQNWNKIVTVFEDDGLIKGKVRSVVKGDPKMLRFLVPDQLLQHILKAKHRLRRQTSRRRQLLTDSEKRAVHIRGPINKVDHRSFSHALTSRSEFLILRLSSHRLNLTISVAAH